MSNEGPITVVSLQRKDDIKDRGLLALGFLVQQRRVLIPEPPGVILNLRHRFDVLIFEIPRVEDASIERIPPAAVRVVYGDRGTSQAIAMEITLARASRHPLTFVAKSKDRRPLNELLASGVGLREALEEAGILPDRLRRDSLAMAEISNAVFTNSTDPVFDRRRDDDDHEDPNVNICTVCHWWPGCPEAPE
jgi:hypothetical protein